MLLLLQLSSLITAAIKAKVIDAKHTVSGEKFVSRNVRVHVEPCTFHSEIMKCASTQLRDDDPWWTEIVGCDGVAEAEGEDLTSRMHKQGSLN